MPLTLKRHAKQKKPQSSAGATVKESRYKLTAADDQHTWTLDADEGRGGASLKEEHAAVCSEQVTWICNEMNRRTQLPFTDKLLTTSTEAMANDFKKTFGDTTIMIDDQTVSRRGGVLDASISVTLTSTSGDVAFTKTDSVSDKLGRALTRLRR